MSTLIDLIGWSLGFGNPTVNLVLVHVVYGLGFTTLTRRFAAKGSFGPSISIHWLCPSS
jgi:hypothetical protein